MMGPRQIDQAALFYEFSLERHVPAGSLAEALIALSICQRFGAIWRHFIARPAGLRLIPNCWSGCCWWVTAMAFVPNGGCARRCT